MPAPPQVASSGQLTLPFIAEFNQPTVGIVYMHRIRGVEFEQLLHSLRPRWTLDVRFCARFDIDRLDRRSVFSMFHSYEVEYRAMQATSLHSRRAEQAEVLKAFASEWTMAALQSRTQVQQLHALLLVDDDEEARFAENLFNAQRSSNVKWNTHVFPRHVSESCL